VEAKGVVRLAYFAVQSGVRLNEKMGKMIAGQLRSV